MFGEAEIANLNKDELIAYDESLKYYRDMKGCLETAKAEGIEEGRILERFALAESLLDLLDDATIASKVGLTVEEISNLRKKSSGLQHG